MNWVKKYFSGYFVFGITFSGIFSLILLIKILVEPEGVRSKLDTILFALIIAIPSGLLISLVRFWYEQIYSPKKRMKMLNHRSLVQFKELGFEEVGDNLEGLIKGYTCRVWWSAYSPKNSNRKAIILTVEDNISEEQVNELQIRYKNQDLIWAEDGVLGFQEILFKVPKHEKLLQKLEEIIDILKSKG